MKISITRPSLLINKDICLNNIRTMATKATTQGLKFRPHFKTHQSKEIGDWFRGFGVDKITVSSVSMAGYFADDGWNDILIAFPANILEIKQINLLAQNINLSLTIESLESLDYLCQKLRHSCAFYIKIDTGYHRTGVQSSHIKYIEQLLNMAHKNPKLKFRGFLVHSGNTYHASDKKEIESIHFDSIQKLRKLKTKFQNDYPDLLLSIGDTPSCSLMNDFKGVDEIRPGNFVFYDIMQQALGSCSFNEIGLALICPVVARHTLRNEIVIYGGAVHLSKEFILTEKGIPVYGKIALFNGKNWEKPLKDTYVRKLSQEHGIIKTTDEHMELFETGRLIAMLPVHSCLSMNLMQNNYITS